MDSGTTSNAPCFALAMDSTYAAICFLSWDTEYGARAERNLLRQNARGRLQLRQAGRLVDCSTLPTSRSEAPGEYRYHITPGHDFSIEWVIRYSPDYIEMQVTNLGPVIPEGQTLELVLPFDAHVTATTVLPTAWFDDGRVQLPLLIHAPDWGQVMTDANVPLTGRLLGNYEEKAVDLVINFGQLSQTESVRLSFTPFKLPQPEAVPDAGLWLRVQRAWLNALAPLAETSAVWQVGVGMVNNRDIHLPGMLGNEVISGCATCSLWFYADHILCLPALHPGISAPDMLRRTLEIILDTRLGRDGSLVCYWMQKGDYSDFLDSHPSMLISIWDYVECTGDLAWLERHLAATERIADFLLRRDTDHDGLVEAVQSGNSGTLLDPQRGCSWWDALNAGHKDGYTNALIYRGWCCLAELEGRLGRAARAQHWRDCAARLKLIYTRCLLNPATGWLSWWRSADGELHDPASPLINAMAIEYGLVSAEQGQVMLDLLMEKMRLAGFQRRDLGIPSTLNPIPQPDYLLGIPPGICGTPGTLDGSDTFGQYQNGGIHAGHTLPYLAALYLLNRGAEADAILDAMIGRLQLGLFQNGVWGKSPYGGEWTTWDGQPSGADGYLADNYRFLQAIFLREPGYRTRLYRPLGHVNAQGFAR